MRTVRAAAGIAMALVLLVGCSESGDPDRASGGGSTPTAVKTQAPAHVETAPDAAGPSGADARRPPAPTASPSTTPVAGPDLTTDAGLCAADAEMTSLELNDAIAPLLGFSPVRDERTVEQDDAIRAYKNEAFARACPGRVS